MIKNIFSKNNKKVLLLAGIFVIGLAVFIFVGINNASAVGLCSSCSDTITCDSTLNCSYLGSSYGYGCINANCSYKTTAYCKASSVSSCLGYSIATPPYSDVQVCTLSNGSPVIADDFIGYHYHSFSCNDFYSSSDCYDDWVPYSGCTSGGFWWKVTISAVSVVPPSGTAWDCWSTCSNDSCMGTKLVASLGECPCISTCPFSSAYCSTDPPPYDTGCDKYCPVGTKNDCPSSSTYCATDPRPVNSCGVTCPIGTMSCAPTSVGHIRIQGPSGYIRLSLISATNAKSQGRGVIKVARFNGDTNSAADLVPVDALDASPVRVRTQYGTFAWREL